MLAPFEHCSLRLQDPHLQQSSTQRLHPAIASADKRVSAAWHEGTAAKWTAQVQVHWRSRDDHAPVAPLDVGACVAGCWPRPLVALQHPHLQQIHASFDTSRRLQPLWIAITGAGRWVIDYLQHVESLHTAACKVADVQLIQLEIHLQPRENARRVKLRGPSCIFNVTQLFSSQTLVLSVHMERATTKACT